MGDVLTEQVKIDKGVPLPAATRRGIGGVSKYPWREAEIGDSFLLTAQHATAVPSMIAKWERKLAGRKFDWRRTADGFRVWRTQ